MAAVVDLRDKSLNPKFVAYNLVFGSAESGLLDITSRDLVDAMVARGFKFSYKDADEMLHEWCNLGKLRWFDGAYVVAC